MSAEDTCKPGDPDPTDDPTDLDYRESCPSRDVVGFWCTRAVGHSGQHVAGSGEQVVAVWP